MPSKEREIRRIPFGKLRWGIVVFFYLIWILLSGKPDFFHLGMGLLAVGVVIWLDRRLGMLKEDQRLGESLRIYYGRGGLYLLWLFWEVMKSAYHVGEVILGFRQLDPALVRFRSDEPHTVARVVLANSITLTPGTIILDIEGDKFLVYALTGGARDGLHEGTMQRKVAYVFGRELEDPVEDWEEVDERVKI